MFPYWSITLQLIGVQFILNATGSGQSHACPRIEPGVVTKALTKNTIASVAPQTQQPGG
jgi:hypothetical protein